MSETPTSTQTGSIQPQGPEEHSALFANLVIQHSSLAMMLMGKVPNPESETQTKDLQAARMFIDQLEMIEAKTRGNLTKDEEKLMKQTLMALRLAFVEAVEEEQKGSSKQAETHPSSPAQGSSSPAAGTGSDAAEESHKKFSKKY